MVLYTENVHLLPLLHLILVQNNNAWNNVLEGGWKWMYLKVNILEGGLEIDHSDETQTIKMMKMKFLVHRYLSAIFFP